MKKAFLILFIVLDVSLIRAQKISFEWADQMDQGISLSNSVAADASGNVYVTGWFNGTVDFDPGPGIYALTSTGKGTGTQVGDAFIAKLDAAGNFVWAKQLSVLSGSGQSLGSSISVDLAGNVYSSGDFEGTLDFDPGPGLFSMSTAEGPYILKLDALGNFVWAKQFSTGAVNNHDRSLIADNAGNIYWTNTFSGTVDFDPGPGVFNMISGSSGNSRDASIVKLNTNGDLIWAKHLGGSTARDGGNGYSLASDNSGNLFATGEFSGTVDFDPGTGVYLLSANAMANQYILKLDNSGNFAWAKQLNSNAFSIAIDASGNVYSCGTFSKTVDFDPGEGVYNLTALGTSDMFVSKLDAAGNFLWTNHMGGSGEVVGYSIAADAQGNTFLTGTFNNKIDFNPGNCSSALSAGVEGDIFVCKISPQGGIAAVKQMKGSSFNSGLSITTDAAKNIYTAGFFSGQVDFGPGRGELESAGQSAFIQKLSQCLNSSSSSVTETACKSFQLNCAVYTSSGQYAQTITNASGCDSNITLYLTITDGTITNSVSAESCGPYIWNGQTLRQGGIYMDSLKAGGRCDSIVTLHLLLHMPSFSNIVQTICEGQDYLGHTETGIYRDTLMNAEGCDSIRTVQLLVTGKPQPDLGPAENICEGDSLVLFPGEFTSYLWQNGLTENHYTVHQAGSYSVNVSNQCGSGQAEIAITEKECSILFPSAFTPNDDGKNDVFKILHASVLTDFDMTIFDRWGRKVFESTDYSKGWNGNTGGLKSTPGVYVWFCRFKKTGEPKIISMKGTILLMR